MKSIDTIAVLDLVVNMPSVLSYSSVRCFYEIHSPQLRSRAKALKGLYSGGPSSVYEKDAPAFNPEILSIPVPKLGICYGHQLIATQLGGEVTPGKVKEYGIAALEIKEQNHPLLEGIPQKSPMWMSHGDMVSTTPEGYKVIATTKDCETAAVAYDEKQIYGIQFHPEVTHSQFGSKLLSNFIKICKCSASWNMKSYLPLITERIKNQVQDKNVFLLVSGSVDSTVAFVLLNKF